jgi:hypothetical protein
MRRRGGDVARMCIQSVLRCHGDDDSSDEG